MSFDRQPVLSPDRLHLCPLERQDFDGLMAAASDPATWAGHPARDRWKPEVFRPYFDFLLGAGGTMAIRDTGHDGIIGCSRYYTAPDMPDSISIGFTFINPRFWGGAVNLELKRLMLGHAFGSFGEIWFHIDPTNMRSRRATAKLGAVHVYDATLDLGGGPARWMCFRLEQDAWAAARSRTAAESG